MKRCAVCGVQLAKGADAFYCSVACRRNAKRLTARGLVGRDLLPASGGSGGPEKTHQRAALADYGPSQLYTEEQLRIPDDLSIPEFLFRKRKEAL